MKVIQVMHVILVMQVLKISKEMQVMQMQVSLAHVWVDIRVVIVKNRFNMIRAQANISDFWVGRFPSEDIGSHKALTQHRQCLFWCTLNSCSDEYFWWPDWYGVNWKDPIPVNGCHKGAKKGKYDSEHVFLATFYSAKCCANVIFQTCFSVNNWEISNIALREHCREIWD